MISSLSMIDLDTQEDAVARLGGDEFTVLVKSPLSRDATVGVANRVLGKISEPYQISDKKIRISASIGVSMNYPKGDKPEDLLREANQWMSQAANPKSMCIYMIRALS